MQLELVLRTERRELAPLHIGQHAHHEGDVVFARRTRAEGVKDGCAIDAASIEEDVLLGGKVSKERPAADSGGRRDLLDRHIDEAPAAEQLHRGVDDVLRGPGLLGLAQPLHTQESRRK